MSITLTPQTEARIRHWIEAGRYASVDEALAAAVAFLDEHDRFLRLQATLMEAEEQTRQGRVAEWTPELRERLRGEAETRLAQGDQPSPHVRP